MEYAVVITKEPESLWRAFVPLFPECKAEAETREAVVAQIKDKIAERHFEIIHVEVPDSVETRASNGNIAGNVVKLGTGSIRDFAGIFRDDPTWGEMFDEIERRRDESIVGE